MSEGEARRARALRTLGIETQWRLRGAVDKPADSGAAVDAMTEASIRSETPEMASAAATGMKRTVRQGPSHQGTSHQRPSHQGASHQGASHQGTSHQGASHQGASQPGESNDVPPSAVAKMGWDELQGTVSQCTACGLCKTRQQTVFGSGATRAGLMIVGEAPGAEEDASGEPFVGQAGRLLDNMLAAIGLVRANDVYIANVLKCRPPANRNPQPEEVARCSPYLQRQIELVNPRLILAMGRFAAQALLNSEASIASLRGKVHRTGDRLVVVSYHPAYLLRTLRDKAKAWEDLVLVRRQITESARN